jgi:hypothetical protein
MQAAAHNPAFAKKVGIPQSVARDFVDADRKAQQHKGFKAAMKGK